MELAEIVNVLDASELSSEKSKQQFEQHDVGECIIETSKPIAFNSVTEIENTGRFVIVDNYEIAGGGIILEKTDSSNSILQKHIRNREFSKFALEIGGIEVITKLLFFYFHERLWQLTPSLIIKINKRKTKYQNNAYT